MTDTLEVQRYVLTGSLLFAAYTIYTCPCKPVLGSCHFNEIMLSIGMPLALFTYINRDIVMGKA